MNTVSDYKPDPAVDLLPACISELHVRWLELGGLGPDPANIYLRGRSDGEKAREAREAAFWRFIEWVKVAKPLGAIGLTQLEKLEAELAKAGKGTAP